MRPWPLTSPNFPTMSRYFNSTRFGRLLRKHTAENLTRYLLSAGVLLGGMVLVMGSISYLQGSPPNNIIQKIFFGLFLLAAGGFFGSAAFAQFGAGRQAAMALTLPVSQFEKYLVAWLFSLPFFLVVFVADFYVADWLVMQLLRGAGPAGTLMNVFAEREFTVDMLLALGLVHGVALWGSIYFTKLQFVKTAFLGFGVLAVLAMVNSQVLKQLITPKVMNTVPFSAVRIPEAGQQFVLELPAGHGLWLGLLPLALAALLWLGSYARLTEKQV